MGKVTVAGGKVGMKVPSVLPAIGTALNDMTWGEIALISESGLAADYFSVGDCKKIVLNGNIGDALTLSNYETYVYVIGINHNGATNTIDFGTFKTAPSGGIDVCLTDSIYGVGKSDGTKCFNFNHWGASNVGGWKSCDLRYDILGSTDIAPNNYGSAPTSGYDRGHDATETCATNPVPDTLMAALPAELRAVMKPMTVYTDNVGGINYGSDASHVTASVDYLPIMAVCEIFEQDGGANDYEKNYNKQYPYYSAGNSTIKYNHSSINTAVIWYTRSVKMDRDDTDEAEMVKADGTLDSPYLHYSYGLAPIFRV